MDSVTLRRSHFRLGDYCSDYVTSSVDQNKLIGGDKIYNPAKLELSVKNELRKSHFNFGNQDNNFISVNSIDFTDKSKIAPSTKLQSDMIKTLRSHNYVLGDHQPDYLTESALKYVVPTKSHLYFKY